MRIIYLWLLRILGWKVKGQFPDLKHSVVVMGPHTSNWDSVIGKIYINYIGIKYRVLAKKELFKFPGNILMRMLYAIPVDRKNKHISQTQQVVNVLNNSENMHILLAPEGTRKLATRWKKGFYHIAHEANVPIVSITVDYAKHLIEVKGITNSQQSLENVMLDVNSKFEGTVAKYPENFSIDLMVEIKEKQKRA